jgi:hypothetical protein
MSFENLVRNNQTRDVAPARRPGRGGCDIGPPKTVIIQLGKTAIAAVYGTSFNLAKTYYMTKQQKEVKPKEQQ